MRVAFVLAALGAGGAERVIAILSAAAVKRGWHVTIITFDGPHDPVYHPIDPAVRLARLNLPNRPGLVPRVSPIVQRVLALRRAIRAGHFDVVVSFLTKINVLTLLACVGQDVPVIVSERNNPRRQQANRLWNMLLARLYSRAAAIVMQTRRSTSCLPVSVRDSARVIPNPIVRLPIPAGDLREPRVVAVGRLTEQKGFDLLLPAFARVSADCPEWHLTIWGEGPARSALEEQARSLGVAANVSLPGTSRPGAWIEGASVFVLPSRFEGFPNALAEAMAAGLPSIAFDCDYGPGELIVDGKNGLLVPNRDIHALAAGLRSLLISRELRCRLGAAARECAARHSAEVIAPEWLGLVLQTGSSR